MASVGTAYDRRWWTLAVLCLSLMVTAVDNTILNVALPSIVSDLGAHGSELQWIIDAYTIVFAGLLLTAGSLGDRYGRKGALMLGLTLFGVFSALASRAQTPLQLIICRGLMGIGGAFIFPTTLSILTNTFTGRERGRAIGVWAGVAGLGIVIGPLGGGLLLEHFWWGSVFLVNVPVCIVALVAGHFVIATSHDPNPGQLDPLGAVLSIVALGSLLVGIIEAPDRGWTSPISLGALVTGVIFAVLFLKWETYIDHPMLDVRFFRNPRFSAASITITLTYFALFGSTFLLTQYFQFVLGYSPLKAGAVTAPVAIGIMTFAPMAPRLVERFGTKHVVFTGLLVVTTVLCLYCSDTIMSSAIAGGMVRLLFGVGMGLTTAPATESIMGSLPPGKAGVGSAVNDTTRQTGGALGVAVLGSVFATRYHSIIGSASTVPVAARDAVQDSVGRALDAARSLPPDQQALIHEITRHAYVSSMRVAYGLAAATVLTAAMVTWRFLPDHALASATELSPEDEKVAEAISVTDA